MGSGFVVFDSIFNFELNTAAVLVQRMIGFRKLLEYLILLDHFPQSDQQEVKNQVTKW